MTFFLKEASVNTTEQFNPDRKVERVTPKPLGVPGGVSVTSRTSLGGGRVLRNEFGYVCEPVIDELQLEWIHNVNFFQRGICVDEIITDRDILSYGTI